MPGVYKHINLKKETIIKERRGRSFPPPKFDKNIQKHVQKLSDQLALAKSNMNEQEIHGYDERLLLKLNIRDGFDPSGFESIEGIQLVSQEDKEFILLFATEKSLEEFEGRLSTFGKQGTVTRKDLIEALNAINLWSPEDRKGIVLKKEGFPDTEKFILDVEMWPLSQKQERDKLLESFRIWSKENNFNERDYISKEYIFIIRLECNKANCNLLLKHRDVRTVDLPPRYTFEHNLLRTDISNISGHEKPNIDAPRIGILDSGLNSGHPLLKDSTGDSRSYISNKGPEDNTGHGTAVSGIILYGDIENAITSKTFVPHFWILSARILDDNNEFNDKLIENQIEEAVKEFHTEYGCKIFNLSIGDENRPYTGGKAGSLTMTLDNLSYEYGVLFVVSSGNLRTNHIIEKISNGSKYPNYLFEDAAILEPANAMNVVSVGGITRHDMNRLSFNYPRDPAYQPIANTNSISPFSRIGPGVADCIKPELVSFAGNLGIDYRTKTIIEHGLGEISFNNSFLEKNLFSEHCGTSFAAPYITHLLGRMSATLDDTSILFLRALLISNARIDSLNFPSSIGNKDILRMLGYGKIDEEYLYRSGEDVVVLYSNDQIKNDKNHFYEIPIPDEYFGDRRKREITITLSYFSPVRNTRINYKATRMFFKFVKGESLDSIVKMFDKSTPKDQYKNIPEYSNKRRITSDDRTSGTVQSSTWTLTQPKKTHKYFVVITRNDYPWGEKVSREDEDYSLVIAIRDKEKVEARLYTKIKEMIRARIRSKT